MPIYEYRCGSCGHVFEDMILSYRDKGESKCPKCASERVAQVISGTSFQLKGDGWFHSDYGKPASSAPKSEASGAD